MPTSPKPNQSPKPIGDPPPAKPDREPVPAGDPQPDKPGPDPKSNVAPTAWEISASKKVDDLSRHESKHDLDPKHDPKNLPKPNAREKTSDGIRHDVPQPQGGNPAPGAART